MKQIFILLVILFSMSLRAEVESEFIDDEVLSILSTTGEFIALGEISGIGGKISMNKIESFVTVANEIIPVAQAKVFIPEGKTQTLDNVQSVTKGDKILKRDDLLGVILK